MCGIVRQNYAGIRDWKCGLQVHHTVVITFLLHYFHYIPPLWAKIRQGFAALPAFLARLGSNDDGLGRNALAALALCIK